jgi:hypothetical protein
MLTQELGGQLQRGLMYKGAVMTIRAVAKPGQETKMQSITINLLKSQSYVGQK